MDIMSAIHPWPSGVEPGSAPHANLAQGGVAHGSLHGYVSQDASQGERTRRALATAAVFYAFAAAILTAVAPESPRYWRFLPSCGSVGARARILSVSGRGCAGFAP